MSVLEIRDLHVQVSTDEGPKDILRGVDLTVRAGETITRSATRILSTITT